MLRALIGDLAVATTELAAIPTPRHATSRERFATLYQHGEKLFYLAVEVGIHQALAPQPLDDGMLAPLVEAFEGTYLLMQLCTGIEDAFTAGAANDPHVWTQICLYRSAIEFLRELLQHQRSIREELDTGAADELMRRWCYRLYQPQPEVPADMPRSHWWWYGAPI
jgi:hypothetical protein